jgi:pimeloyl-ACP methyl ester carboxylesterase
LQVPEKDLADPKSCFRHISGMEVHYKVAAHASRQDEVPALALYHGFGANTFSWSFVDGQLAERLQGVVVTHDMPGFGLTQR